MINHISSFIELDNILGNDFIVFCGSAISGGIYDSRGKKKFFLPMVNMASEKFYYSLSITINKDSYLNKTLSRYSFELAQGKYKKNRLNTKFEDFLWRVEEAVGEVRVAELIKALFYCESGEYLHNHFAIGELFNIERIKLTLTTNFDNAIKRAYPKINRIVHAPGFSMTKIPNISTIIKLHGDVTKGIYVATIPKLVNAEKTQDYSYLDSLFGNKTVLVAGYSGTGDIDIAPYFYVAKQNGARLIWIVKPGSSPPEMATDFFTSDLFSKDPSNNCLLKLANINKPKVGRFPNWESNLNSWINRNSSTSEAKKIIEESLRGISGWGKLHIYQVNKWESPPLIVKADLDKDLFLFGGLCVGVGAVYSALKTFQKIDRANVKSQRQFLELLYQQGFANWRLVRLQKASNLLRHFVYQSANKKNIEFIEMALRVYLEVVRDILKSFTNKKSANNYFFDHQIDKASSKLLEFASNTNNPSNEILAELVKLDIEHIIGMDVQIDIYRNLFQRATDLKLWLVAKVAAHSILRMSLGEGIQKLNKLFSVAGGGWKWHSVKHNTLAFIDKFPKIIVSPSHLLNHALSKPPALIREFQLMYRLSKWKIIYWISRVIVE